jgi:tRNA pseudouridine38-40 synthase
VLVRVSVSVRGCRPAIILAVPTYRLTLEYEGTRYRGWQEQQNARSVAGELKRAIAESAGEIKDLGGAGRTDAGVHALAQTAHLRLGRAVEPEAFRRAVNDRLPPDIHLLDVRPAAADFHARHGAVSRSYLYQISRRRTALAKRFVWWVKSPLNTRLMAESAALLVGRHDFRLFCERPAEQASTLVVVEGAELATAGALVLVRLSASHFLWKMVRRVVGALVEVGSGRLAPAAFAALLAGRAPKGGGLPAEWTAPPSGLFLERMLYPGDPPLPPLAPAVPVAAEPVG